MVGEEGEDPLQQCSRLQGRAVPGAADAELPWHLPWFSLQLIDEVVDDLLSPGIQVESAEWGKEWWWIQFARRPPNRHGLSRESVVSVSLRAVVLSVGVLSEHRGLA